MTTLLSSTCNIMLEPVDFARVIHHMNTNGWLSMHWHSKAHMLALANMSIDDKTIPWICFHRRKDESLFSYQADVFIKGPHLFYVKTGYSFFHHKLEVGVITNHAADAYNLLSSFARTFTHSLKKAIDGRTHRHWDLRWWSTDTAEKVDGHRYNQSHRLPELDDVKIKAAQCLADTTSRELLIQCVKNRKTSYHRLDTADAAPLVKAQLLRPVEGDERYEVTPLGRTMTTSSHWMTVWLTQLLIEKEIPPTSIIWALTEDGEEVDLAVQIKNKVIFFEVKDRDFESGDAQPFHHRKVKFNADKLVVLVTGKVREPAKKVFKDFQKASVPYPVYIEGINAADTMISDLLHNIMLTTVYEKCLELSIAMDIDLKPIFNKLFGKLIPEREGGFVKERPKPKAIF